MIQLKEIFDQVPELKDLGIKQRKEYENEIVLLMENIKELLVLQEKYANVLSRYSELNKNIEDLKHRLFPSIYFGIVKHHTTKEPYIIARSLWKIGTNDYSQLSAYIGPVARFAKGVNDPEVLEIAKDKIMKKIREKFPKE